MDGVSHRACPDERLADDFAEALRRARADFIEMPGLTLTAAQAARFWRVDSMLCTRVLDTLVESRFLTRTGAATFARL